MPALELLPPKEATHFFTKTIASLSPEDDPYAELSAVEAEVESVSAMLIQLTQRVQTLKARINQVHSVVIRSLPPEIIAEIFQCCIPPFEPYDASTNCDMPFLLGSICSVWRTIAWNTPAIWASVTPELPSTITDTQIDFLAQWISRAGELPLCIRLIFPEELNWCTPSNPESILRLINQYSARWQDLDLRIPTSCYRFLPSSGLPLLRSLHLNPPGGQGDRRHRIKILESPHLHHLNLCCIYLYSVKFNWNIVTHLHLEAFYIDECLQALSKTTQLVSCTIRNIIGGDEGHPVPQDPIQLSTLEVLNIDNEKDANISLLFAKIAIPKAAEFSYTGGTLLSVSDICLMLDRSGCTLKTFSLANTQTTESCFIQLLRSMTSLTKMVLKPRTNLPPVTNTLLNLCNPWLCRLNKTDCMLPKLRVLEYCGPQTFLWSVLVDTLTSRRADTRHPATLPAQSEHDQYIEVSSLRSVAIRITHNSPSLDSQLDEDTLASIRRLDGMNICISSLSSLNHTAILYRSNQR